MGEDFFTYAGLAPALLCNISLALIDKRTSGQLAGKDAILSFSFVKTLLCATLAALILPFGTHRLGGTGIVIGSLAGLFHASSVLLIMRSLQCAPAAPVNLIMSAGIVCPVVIGWGFLGDGVTVWKILALLMLIASLGIVLECQKGQKNTTRLLIPLFFSYGMLMVAQNLFPRLCPDDSNRMFSLIMYGVSAVILGIAVRLRVRERLVWSRHLKWLAVTVAAVNLAINLLLVMLSARLHASVVFPVVHGLKLVVLTSLSPILWKQKLTVVQLAGCAVAIVSICVLAC